MFPKDGGLFILPSFDGSLDSLTGYDPSLSPPSPLSDQRSSSQIKNETSSDISDLYDNKNPISVTKGIRLHLGDVVVKGTITSIFKVYKMIKSVIVDCQNCCTSLSISYPIRVLELPNDLSKCKGCQSSMKIKIEYINAVTIEIQDSDTFSEIEKLSGILFDENTIDIQVGSKVLISGSIQIINQKKFLLYKKLEIS